MNRVISSQRYVNEAIVEAYMEEAKRLENPALDLDVWDVGLTDLDGEKLYMLFDGHHRFEAYKRLGYTVQFHEVPSDTNLTGEDLLEQFWMDSDWYDVRTEQNIWN